MAKKAVASLQTGSKKLTKAIRMIKKDGSDSYSFDEKILPQDLVNDWLAGKSIVKEQPKPEKPAAEENKAEYPAAEEKKDKDDDQDRDRLVVDIYFYVVGVPGPQVVQTFLQRVR